MGETEGLSTTESLSQFNLFVQGGGGSEWKPADVRSQIRDPKPGSNNNGMSALVGLDQNPLLRWLLKDSYLTFITFAGTPPAVVNGGTFLVTTEPAPICAFLPIFTPIRMTLPAPMSHPSSNTIGAR